MDEYDINMDLLREITQEPTKTAIHCDENSKAVALLEALKKLGWTWFTGEDLSINTRYEEHKQETCYSLSYKGWLKYGDKKRYEEDLHYKIVEFDNLLVEPTIDAESFCNFLGGISDND